MSNMWVITDTHFGHAKMIPYCGRPEDFSEIILFNLNKIPDDDILIHLGDICMGDAVYWHEKLSSFKFKKILVLGNHDKKGISWYYDHGWDFVCNSFTIRFMGKNLLFSHEPLSIVDNNFNIHGHFHNTLHHEDMFGSLTKNHICLSIEDTNYQPVRLNDLINTRLGTS